MQSNTNLADMSQVASHFCFTGDFVSAEPMGNGHINVTFRIMTKQGSDEHYYTLQQINHHVFPNVGELMQNMSGVTAFLSEKLKKLGRDHERGTLHLIPTQDGKPYYLDPQGNYWRSYAYIDHVVALDRCDNADDFRKSGFAFGEFQYLLQDFPVDQLHETIVDFHNTPKRLQRLKEAYAADKVGRAKEVQQEYEFALQREQDCESLFTQAASGQIPMRVTHNDTKLNNILLDENTGDPVCIIDLDTVMPGLSAHDFGDAIRFGASTAAEDEVDLSKVGIDLNLFEQFAKGYIDGANGCMTAQELAGFPMGAKLMTLECGIRFLTDYLEGDTYFAIHREKHNLDRARAQFKLVSDMEQKWQQMNQIIQRLGDL